LADIVNPLCAAYRCQPMPPWASGQHAGFDGSTLKIIHKISDIFRNDATT